MIEMAELETTSAAGVTAFVAANLSNHTNSNVFQ